MLASVHAMVPSSVRPRLVIDGTIFTRMLAHHRVARLQLADLGRRMMSLSLANSRSAAVRPPVVSL